MAMTRRKFLRVLAAGAAAAPLARASMDTLGAVLPIRTLGRRGPEVTCLGLGGFHIGWTTEALAQATIETALEEGIRFFDTAESYGPHTSEERYGRYLVPAARDQIFLMTKSTAKTVSEAQEHLEGSLRRMKTDVIDLWQLHALESPQDADARLDAGILDYALKARAEGKIRRIGFTGHANPYALSRMLERTGGDTEPFAACQFPINPVDAVSAHSFIRTVFPSAQDRGLGVLAMKTLADGRFFAEKTMNGKAVWSSKTPLIPGQISLEDCLSFALSLPVSVLITGAEKPEFVRDKAAIVRSFHQLSPDERLALSTRVADRMELEFYKDKNLRG